MSKHEKEPSSFTPLKLSGWKFLFWITGWLVAGAVVLFALTFVLMFIGAMTGLVTP